MKKLRKLGSVFLALALCLALLPTAAWAAEEGPEEPAEEPSEPDASGYSVEVSLTDGETEVELNNGEATVKVTATITAPEHSSGSVFLRLSLTSGTNAKSINYQEGNSATKTYDINRGKIPLSFSNDRTASITFTITFGVAGTRDFLFSVLDEDGRTLASEPLKIIVKTPQTPLTEMYIGTVSLTSGGYYVVDENQTVTKVEDGEEPPSSPYARLYWDVENDSAWTLELNNFTYSGTGHTGSGVSAALYAAGDLTIVLTGTNRLTCTEAGSASTNAGVYVDGALTFTGAGSLTAIGADVTGEFDTSCGIYTYGSITMAGTGTVTGTGGDSSGDYGTSYGVWAAGGSGSITVERGSLTGTGGSGPTSGGVKAYVSIEVKGDGSLEGTAGAASASGGDLWPSSVGVDADHQITVQDRGVLTGTGGTAKAGESSAESTGVHGFGITVRDNGDLTGTAEAAENNSVRSSATSMGVTAGDLGITVQDNGTLTGTAGPAVNHTLTLDDYHFTNAYAANSVGVDSGGTFTIQDSGVLTGEGGGAVCSADSSRTRSYGLSVFLAKEATPPAMALDGGRTTARGYTCALNLGMNDIHGDAPLLTIAKTFDYAWRTAAGGSYIQGNYTYNAAATYTYLEILPASQAVIPVTGVTLSENTLTLTVGGTGTLTATVSPGNATNRAVTWTSSDTAVATVSNGVVTAVSPGTATITVTTEDGNKTATCAVTVTAATVPVTGVTLNKTSTSLYVGDTETLTPTITPDNATNKNVTWSSDDTSVATVDASGLVTAVARGTAVITATAADGSGANASCTVTVSRYSSGGGSSSSSTSLSDRAIDDIQDARPGDTVEITLRPGRTTLEREVFEELAGQDITLEIDAGDGVLWTVNGLDIPEDTRLHDLDLDVDLGDSGIPATVLNAVTGEIGTVQLSLAHDGEFGFTMTLSAPLGRDNADYWANLYWYNERTEELEFQQAARIANDGTAEFALDHASDYAIVIDDRSHEPVDLPFNDVPEGYWAYDAIQYVYGEGLMAGTSGSTFSPEGTTTRGQIVTILWRLSGSPVVNYAMDYNDVDPAAYYAEAIRWATSEGIAGGYGGGLFGPDDPITREQLAVMLHRYAQHEGYDVSIGEDTNILSYADAFTVSEYAVSALQWACGAGIISGTGDGSTLTPQGEATRAQAATVLMRFCNMYGNP